MHALSRGGDDGARGHRVRDNEDAVEVFADELAEPLGLQEIVVECAVVQRQVCEKRVEGRMLTPQSVHMCRAKYASSLQAQSQPFE